MKILDLKVNDPLSERIISIPRIVLEIDEMADSSACDIKVDNDESYIIEFNGSLIQFELFNSQGKLLRSMGVGEFNSRLSGNKLSPAPVVICDVTSKSFNDVIVMRYAIRLSTARRLMKKHCPAWRLVVSDHRARYGILQWVPERKVSKCMWWLPDYCSINAVTTCHYNGVDVPLCAYHVEEQNKLQASRRVLKSALTS